MEHDLLFPTIRNSSLCMSTSRAGVFPLIRYDSHLRRLEVDLALARILLPGRLTDLFLQVQHFLQLNIARLAIRLELPDGFG